MSSEGQVKVRVTHRFDTTPEKLFDAWLDPEMVRQWMFVPTPGEMVRVDIDARVGGSFCFVHRRDGQDVEHVGEYLEIDRPRRLAFTWAVADEEGSDRVTVDIVPVEGGCELTLTHELDPEWAEDANRTEAAWSGMFDALAALTA